MFEKYQVEKVHPRVTYDYIKNKHYAKRLPPISYAFAIYKDGFELVGVLTIGKPASNSLCEGVCGVEQKNKVYELNRLFMLNDQPRNLLSYFVSKCLKMLKEDDLILVSYADTAMNHHGFIYQATNWLYTGKTKSRTDKYTKEGKHSRHYKNEDESLRKFRSSKHRYIYFTGKSKKIYMQKLNYEIKPYPKGENENYEHSFKLKDKVIKRG